MSSALAIASVTAVLRDLLNNGVIDHNLPAIVGTDVLVSALPPDRIDSIDANPQERKSRINLFLYQVTSNAGWRNAGLPARDGAGEHISNPPLGVDLHYLLTAYGVEEMHAEILLGYGMQLLHETPVLTRAAIRTALAPPTPVLPGGDLPAAMRNLFTSELAEQVELIKIVPQSLSAEEVSRMWTAIKANYRASAFYQASVVLIESRRSTRSALPVRARKVKVVQFKQPVIEEIRSQATPNGPILTGQPILAGNNLVLIGTALKGEDTQVNIGGIAVPQGDLALADTQIIAPIPQGITAGVQGVQVIQRIDLGEPPLPHRGLESNVAAFVLRPQILSPIGVSNLQGTGNNPRSATLNIQVSPAVGATQRVAVLLNEFLPAASPPQSGEMIPNAYSFTVSPQTATSPPAQNITVSISGVKAADYLVRVQVDGAESPLDTNAAGQYVSPRVTIP